MLAYELIDLGDDFMPIDMNETGSIAGLSHSLLNPARGVVWKNGSFKKLPPFAGHSSSSAFAINNAGLVAGRSSVTDNNGNYIAQACSWQNSTSAAKLVDPGPAHSTAIDVNDVGEIVGEYDGNPVRWIGGVRQLLPVLPSASRPAGQVNAINSNTFAVGYTDTGVGFPNLATAWTKNGNVLPLNTPKGVYGEANSVNIGDIAVGTVTNNIFNSYFDRPYVWSPIGNFQLPLPTTAVAGRAEDINDAGLIVGISITPPWELHAMSWFGNIMTDLNTLIDPMSGWILTIPSCVNNNGWIAGWGTKNGNYRAWLLRPVIEVKKIKVEPAIWHFIIGGQADGPGIIMTAKGPIRVPPWTPWIKTLPREIRPLIQTLLDSQPKKIKSRGK